MEGADYRKFNRHQTELTEELLDSLPPEEKNDLLDYIDSIMFIQNLASPDRPYAKDLDRWDNPFGPDVSEDDMPARKKDPNGRIAIDLSNPHILEDMDYFRPAAIHFELWKSQKRAMAPQANRLKICTD